MDCISELSSLLQDSAAPSRAEDTATASTGSEHKVPFCTALLQLSCQQSCCVSGQWTALQTAGTSDHGTFERVTVEGRPSRSLLHHVTLSVIRQQGYKIAMECDKLNQWWGRVDETSQPFRAERVQWLSFAPSCFSKQDLLCLYSVQVSHPQPPKITHADPVTPGIRPHPDAAAQSDFP